MLNRHLSFQQFLPAVFFRKIKLQVIVETSHVGIFKDGFFAGVGEYVQFVSLWNFINVIVAHVFPGEILCFWIAGGTFSNFF